MSSVRVGRVVIVRVISMVRLRKCFVNTYVLGRVPDCNIATRDDANAQPKCCTKLNIAAAVAAAQATNQSSCIIKESNDPGRYIYLKLNKVITFYGKFLCRYLCAFSYYQSLLINNRCSVFIHVPEPSSEVSPSDVVAVLATVIANLIKQL